MKIIFELLMLFPLYAGIFVIFFCFRYKIKLRGHETLFDLFLEEYAVDCVNKREYLLGKLENRETISNSKTPGQERLQKASDKVALWERSTNKKP